MLCPPIDEDNRDVGLNTEIGHTFSYNVLT